MASLFKIQAYIVDANDDFKEVGSLEDYLRWRTENYCTLKHVHVERADLGEWDDNLPINYVNCPESEFEKYFQEEQ